MYLSKLTLISYLFCDIVICAALWLSKIQMTILGSEDSDNTVEHDIHFKSTNIAIFIQIDYLDFKETYDIGDLQSQKVRICNMF